MDYSHLNKQRKNFSQALNTTLKKHPTKSSLGNQPLNTPTKTPFKDPKKRKAKPEEFNYFAKTLKLEINKKAKNKYPYAVSFFDRYVDLSKYDEESSIYPMIRDWTRNYVVNSVSQPNENENSKSQTFTKSELDQFSQQSNLIGPLSNQNFKIIQEKLSEIKPEQEVADIGAPGDINSWSNRWKNVKKKHLVKSKVLESYYKDDVEVINRMLPT